METGKINRLENLRWATIQENNRNKTIFKNNTSGAKGVYLKKETNKWGAYITTNYTKIHIGYFFTLEEAKNARRNKAIELFGEFINECEL